MTQTSELRTHLALWGTLLLVAIFGILFLMLNHYVPLFADDYCRWGTGFKLRQVLESVKGEYFGWSGRFPVMFLNYAFFSSGKTGVVILEVLNSVALAAACYLAIVIARCERSFWCRACAIVCFGYLWWWAPDVFGEVALWKTGTVQYFWGMVVATAAVAPAIVYAIWNDDLNPSLVACIAYAIAAFLGGAWLENLSPAVAIVWLSALLYARLARGNPVPKWLVIGLLCWIAGAVILIAAPGNYVRADLVATEISIWDRVLYVSRRLPSIPNQSLLIVFIAFVLISVWTQSMELRRRLLQAAAFVAVGIFAAYALIAVPTLLFTGRTAFATEYFFALSVMSVFPREVFAPNSAWSERMPRIALVILSIILVVSFVTSMKQTRDVYRSVSKQEQRRQAEIDAAKEQGLQSVELPPLIYSKRRDWHTGKAEVNVGHLFGRDIGYKSSEFPNTCYASAHGMQKVLLRRR